MADLNSVSKAQPLEPSQTPTRGNPFASLLLAAGAAAFAVKSPEILGFDLTPNVRTLISKALSGEHPLEEWQRQSGIVKVESNDDRWIFTIDASRRAEAEVAVRQNGFEVQGLVEGISSQQIEEIWRDGVRVTALFDEILSKDSGLDLLVCKKITVE